MAVLTLLLIPVAMADGWAERSYSCVFLAAFFAVLALVGEVVSAMLRHGVRGAATSVKVLALLHVAVAVCLARAVFTTSQGDALGYLAAAILIAAFAAIGIAAFTGAQRSSVRSA